MVDHRFVVITGGPGVGKTALITELSKRHYPCIGEVAREIIKEQLQAQGNALPWGDREAYCALMLKRSLEAEQKARSNAKVGQIVFLDRGIPDILAYTQLVGIRPSRSLTQAIADYRYNEIVFLLPPWKEIYVTDEERKQDFEEAIRTDEWMRKSYLQSGYQICEVPRISSESRADYVIAQLSRGKERK